MALIYQKLTEKTLILDPREYLLRPFDLGAAWTEIRFGIYYTMVTSAGDNTDCTAEGVTVNTPADWFALGIKDSGAGLPGTAGSLFLGALAGPAAITGSLYASPTNLIAILSGAGRTCLAGYSGVTLKGSTADVTGGNAWPFQNASGASGYNAFLGVKFVVANAGLVTQTVALTYATALVAGTDYSVNALRTSLNNGTYAPYGAGAPTPWNDGVAALALPTAVWVRCPYFNNRMRISAMEIIRYV